MISGFIVFPAGRCAGFFLVPAFRRGISFAARFWYNLGNGPRAFLAIDSARKGSIVKKTNGPAPVFAVDQADEAVAARVNELLASQGRALLAIDGNCCAGKTTTAARLGALLDANVFHLDDYFLTPELRTPQRLAQPGGNVDAERFLSDVLLPASRGETAFVNRYDCHEDRLLGPVPVPPKRVVIVEGAYSLHPLLFPCYDLKIFCRIDPALQIERIRRRNGEEQLSVFLRRWIPLENAYFQALDVESACDIRIESTQR